MSKFASSSYNPDACCGSDCFYYGSSTAEEPCWGDVDVIDEECTADYEDCWWIHGCQGHKGMWSWLHNEGYQKEPKEEVKSAA